jgi:hypothetical protein
MTQVQIQNFSCASNNGAEVDKMIWYAFLWSAILEIRWQMFQISFVTIVLSPDIVDKYQDML